MAFTPNRSMTSRVFLLFAFFLLAGCARHGEGIVVFQSNRDGNFEIYSMKGDGSGQLRLTDNPANDISPAWSPDGSRIVFTSDRDGTWDIYTMNADGTGLAQLTRGQGTNTAPAWGGGGSEIVFVSTRDAVTGEIYRMKADGADVRRITKDSLVKDTPVMTRDGRHVLVTVNNRGRFAVASIALGDHGVSILTPPESNNESPVLSSDGGEVLFASDRDGKYCIYAMSLDGSTQRRVTSTDADERTPDYTATPGTILVAKRGGIYQRTAGTTVQPVLSYKGDYAPRWHTR